MYIFQHFCSVLQPHAGNFFKLASHMLTNQYHW